MKRRQFITLVGGAAAAWPLAARAQQSSNRIPVVGVLWHAGSAEGEDVYLSVIRKAFNDLGYIEGKNIVLEHRFPAENPERFRILARELVDAKPDAIIAVTVLGAVELKKLTDTIPIVFWLNFKSRASRRQYHRCHEYRSGISRQTVGDFERDRSGSIEGRYPD
jgi:putative tryptophan/tyrosine transport system substrate-binding protein